MNLLKPIFPRPPHRVARRARRGFALIVTLSLMTLLLLLVLALTTLVQLNLSDAKTNLYNAEAKQNALLAAYIAIGQLQKFAGPDQRVTTTADIGRFGDSSEADADNSKLTGLFGQGYGVNSNSATPVPDSPTPVPFGAKAYIQGGTRYWTAVWGEGSDPLGLYTGHGLNGVGGDAVSPDPILLNWLVSGDENTPLLANTYVGGQPGNGVVQKQAAPTLFPNFSSSTNSIHSVGSPDYTTWNALTSDITMQPQSVAQLPQPAIVLVGPNSAATNSGVAIIVNSSGKGGPVTQINKVLEANNMVVVPLVNITEPSESTAGTVASGRYAWYVEDEGVKAKYNIVDPYAGQIAATTAGSSGQLSRYRFNAPMRTGIERMSRGAANSWDSYSAISSSTSYNPAMAAQVNSILEPSELLLIDKSLQGVTPGPLLAPAIIPQETLQLHYHDFTTYSYGVLADALRGGLRYDLTAAFEPGNSVTLESHAPASYVFTDKLNGLTNRAIIPASAKGVYATTTTTTEPNAVGGITTAWNTPPVNGLTNVPDGSAFHGPAAQDALNPLIGNPGLKWDVLQSFYSLANLNTGTQTAVPMQSATSAQAGISPVILEARLRFGNYADVKFEHYIAIQPLFVLANPYNFPITDPGGGLDLGFRINTDTQWEWGFAASSRNDDRASNPPTNIHSHGVGFVIGADLTQNEGVYNSVPQLGPPGFSGDEFYTTSQKGADPRTTLTIGNAAYPIEGYYPFLKNPVSYKQFVFPTGNETNQLYDSALDMIAFHIPHVDANGNKLIFQPGEAKVFVLSEEKSNAGNTNLYFGLNSSSNYKMDPTLTLVSVVGTAIGTAVNTPNSYTFKGSQVVPVMLQAYIPQPPPHTDNYYLLRDTGISTAPTQAQLNPNLNGTVAMDNFTYLGGTYAGSTYKSGSLPANYTANVSATANITYLEAYANSRIWPAPDYAYISTMYGSVAMTLELRYDMTEPAFAYGSDYSTLPVAAGSASGTIGNSYKVAAVGTNLLQSLTNLDLTGDGYSTSAYLGGGSLNPAGSNNPGSPQGFRRQYLGTAQGGYMPVFLADYAMAMALPGNFDQPLYYYQDPINQIQPPTAVNGTFDPAEQGTYRTYYDYNLRAANMNLPPFAPLNPGAPAMTDNSTLANGTSVQVPTDSDTLPAATGFINLPPYGRIFNQGQGQDNSVNPTVGDTSYTAGLGQNSTFQTSATTTGANLKYDTGWGYALGGNYTDGNSTGQQFAVLYGIPQRASATAGTLIPNSNTGQAVPDVPILSLGQLQHADVTADDEWVSVGYQPGNAIGNSYSNLYVSRAASVQTHAAGSTLPMQPWAKNILLAPAGAIGANATNLTLNTTINPLSNANAYDISYLMNVALWDRYFFSTLSQTGATLNPANSRLKYAAGYAPAADKLGITGGAGVTVVDPATGLTMFRAYAPARYMMIDGAFNINSTSLEAWRAILSAMRNVAYNKAAGTDANGNPVVNFPRTATSPDLAAETANGVTANSPISPTNATTGENPGDFAGFRQLTDFDIDALASKIVQQVRFRGPFLSLAQFVNRRLTPKSITPASDPTSISGAIQTAIDISTGLLPSQNAIPLAILNGTWSNSSINTNLLPGTGTSNQTAFYPDSGDAANSGEFSSNNLPYPSGSADPFSRMVGMPGWLTQADILEALAPILAARSDTFVIRTYGEVLSPEVNQKDILGSIAQDPGYVLSRAWCEMVVQRVPDYVYNDDAAHMNDPSVTSGYGAPNPAALGGYNALAQDTLNPVNATFGRRFRIVSVKWLSPTDI